MQGIFQKENTDKALKYGIYRHLPTYEKIIRNLVSFLVNNLSFLHIREIMVLNDAFERFFYETECMKCNWNVRKLRRQIKTNLYVRAGIIKYT